MPSTENISHRLALYGLLAIGQSTASIDVRPAVQTSGSYAEPLFESGLTGREVPDLAVQHRERPGPADPICNMNELQKIEGGKGGLSVRLRVLAPG